MTGPLAPRRGTRAWYRIRSAWQLRIDANNGWACRRCLGPIPPLDPSAWHLGHPNDMTEPDDLVTLDELEPECAACNTSAGATAGNLNRDPDRRKPPPPSRTWL